MRALSSKDQSPGIGLRTKVPYPVNGKVKPVLPSLGPDNNASMFLCPIDPFLDHYGPCQVEGTVLNASIDHMVVENEPVLFCDDCGNYSWSEFRAFPTNRGIPGSKMFKPLGRIIDSVMGTQNNIRLCHVLRPQIPKDPMASMHIAIDAYFIEGVTMAPPLQNVDMNAPEQLEKDKTKASRKTLSRSHVQLQVLGSSHETLSKDPRRMWIYSISFENSLASIWYFSRSHSVKSVAFDWIQDPALFIRVLLMFRNATQRQLGIDPTIHLGPSGKDGMPCSYVYEVPGESDVLQFFKTVRSLASEPSTCIAGRTTRVWEVIQVTSADGKVEVSDKTVVLKDVWLDVTNESVKTEADNMDAIFRAVDKFVEAGLELEINDEIRQNSGVHRETLLSDPEKMEQLMTQFIDHERRFHAFDDATKKRLRENLSNKKYRSMFLTKLHAWRGIKSRDVIPAAKLFPKMFVPWPLGMDAVDALFKEERWEQKLKKNMQEGQLTDDCSHPVAQRQQCRFIYEEVCTTLQNLDTVGDVVDILCGTIDVLHVLFAAGWVHRDISANNLMAYRPARDHPWTVKLADLEFSQSMVERAVPDSGVGTPFFMPVEISSQLLLSTVFLRYHPQKGNNLADELGVKKADNPEVYKHLRRITQPSSLPLDNQIHKPTGIVNHNFQHDLESIWWILLWTITCRVEWGESASAVSNYFKNSMNDFKARLRLFTTTTLPIRKVLHKNLDDLGAVLEPFRCELLQNYVTRGILGHIDVPESYSKIHAMFATMFREIQALEGNWRGMRLKRNMIHLDDRTENQAYHLSRRCQKAPT